MKPHRAPRWRKPLLQPKPLSPTLHENTEPGIPLLTTLPYSIHIHIFFTPNTPIKDTKAYTVVTIALHQSYSGSWLLSNPPTLPPQLDQAQTDSPPIRTNQARPIQIASKPPRELILTTRHRPPRRMEMPEPTPMLPIHSTLPTIPTRKVSLRSREHQSNLTTFQSS